MSIAIATPQIITLCAPEGPVRLDPNRLINIVDLLPEYLKETETRDVIQFFQDFLNTLYDDHVLTTSATQFELENTKKISILEKINRLADLHNPEEIDITYLQFLANYLGYDVNINSGELGVVINNDPNDICVQEDVNRYLRFVVTNLPNWYNIKTTNNAIKIMLFSFGLIGDLIPRWTSDYKAETGANWINFKEGIDSTSDLPENFYPTSHFITLIKLDESTSTFLDPVTPNGVLKAIMSIKPVNAVFDGLLGYMERTTEVSVKSMMRTSLHLHIK